MRFRRLLPAAAALLVTGKIYFHPVAKVRTTILDDPLGKFPAKAIGRFCDFSTKEDTGSLDSNVM
jgi:hypothetical protein